MELIQKYEARLIISGNMLEVYLYDKTQAKKQKIDEDNQELNEKKFVMQDKQITQFLRNPGTSIGSADRKKLLTKWFPLIYEVTQIFA